jgi:hypothetical protein
MRNYQRGVLLGLTLAEVFILLLFVVLLALKKNHGDSKGGSLSNSVTSDGIAPAEEYGKNKDTFPIPETPQNLVLNGSPLPTPPAIGITQTNSFFNKSNETKGASHNPSAQVTPSDPKTVSTIKNKPGHNWPPIITITEAQGYSFPTGSAAISLSFEELLKTKIASTLKKNVADYNADIIEVFGHTDEQPKSGQSNLDGSLINAINGRIPILKLQSADNVGLGMARAVAVVQVLSTCPELEGVTILPYSAGQAINSIGALSAGVNENDPSRRRIEIRLRGNPSN